MTTFAELTTIRVGGPITDLVTAMDEATLIAAVADADASCTPCLVLGGGSNLLVGDDAFDGRVVRIATTGIDVTPGNDVVLVDVAAGEPWDDFVEFTTAQGWSGVEALSGIPGLVGATPIQNVGAYGQDVGQVISHVTVYDRTSRHVTTLDRDELAFGYRTSALKREPDRYVVLAVAFVLRPARESAVAYAELARALDVEVGDAAPPFAIRRAVLRLRRAKGMVLDANDVDSRSLGSFFTNPIVDEAMADRIDACPRFPTTGGVKLSAAWLIERAGVGRGTSLGTDARVSSKHSLALVNTGSARAADVLALAAHIRDRVQDAFGVTLTPEPRLLACAL